MSSYQASPREGHLEQLLQIVVFLKRRPKLSLYFDLKEARFDKNMFNGNYRIKFLDHYRDAKEELPDRVPKPRGEEVKLTCFFC